MSKSIQVGASVLCADFTRLGDQVRMCEDAGADLIHVDVMDGHFVPNISIGPVIVQAIRRVTRLPIEAHLMIEHPGFYIQDFINAGSDIISLQVECYGTRRKESREFGQFPKELESFDPQAALADIWKIKSGGKKAFVVVNPGTPLCFDGVLKDIDGVLVMSVNPGFAGQKFIPEVLPKIAALRAKFTGDIAVDGGVNAETAPGAARAGANIMVTASYFFGSNDPPAAVKFLKRLPV